MAGAPERKLSLKCLATASAIDCWFLLLVLAATSLLADGVSSANMARSRATAARPFWIAVSVPSLSRAGMTGNTPTLGRNIAFT
jgi:hypothetical protein